MKKLLLVLLVFVASCGNPIDNAISPNGETVVLSHPDSITVNRTLLSNGFDLTGYDTMTISYDFRENTTDTNHTIGLAIYTKDSTDLILGYYWSLPFNKTNQFQSHVKEFDCRQIGKVFFTYITFSNVPVVIRNLKITRR